MSIETWKKEFYPKSPTKGMSKIKAIEHSLLKWEGLKKSNLKKHGLIQKNTQISDSEGGCFITSAESCALCMKYYDEYENIYCAKCPIVSVTNGIRCDYNGTNKDFYESPFGQFVYKGETKYMIALLKKTLKEAKGV